MTIKDLKGEVNHGIHHLEQRHESPALRYGKSNAQVILRWHTQVGDVVIPGSKNVDHIRDNINIFDFTLTDDELAEIAKVDQNKRYYEATEEALQGYLAFAPNFNDQP